MKEFIEFIAKHLVDNPDGVSIEEKILDDEKLIIYLKVSPEDIGKVIGKQGRTVQAMRTLLTAVAAKYGKRVIIEVLD
ncbi:MAG: KH domain-containing protein [Ignavibacteria bacterium]